MRATHGSPADTAGGWGGLRRVWVERKGPLAWRLAATFEEVGTPTSRPANPGDVRTAAGRAESEDRNEPREPSQRGLATHISRSRLVFSIL